MLLFVYAVTKYKDSIYTLCGVDMDNGTQRETVVHDGETKNFRLSIDAF